MAVTLGADSEQEVWVNGVQVGKFAVGGFNADLIEISIQGKTIFVRGKKRGETLVFVVDHKGAMNAFMVKVTESAALIPSSLKINVTGKISDSFVNNMLLDVILQNVTVNEGGQLSIQRTTMNNLFALPPDRSAIITLPIIATGNSLADIKKEVMVVVNNIPITYKEDDYLLICNTPEILTEGGLILSQDIKNNESIRLVYHHMNEIQGPPRSVKVIVKNSSQDPIELLFNRALGGPHQDSLFVGHIANKRFMSQLLNQNGVIVTIPPGEDYVVATQTMWNGEESITGIIKLWLLQGKNATVEVRAYDFLDEKHIYDKVTSNFWLMPDQHKSHVRGAFMPSSVSINASLYLSDLPFMFNLGVSPNVYDVSKDILLLGNYGVIHHFNFLIDNNTVSTQDITISCFPAGGFARIIFLLNDEYIETGILDPHKDENTVIKSFSLAAGDKQKIKMMTIPQAGSSYPIRLIIDQS